MTKHKERTHDLPELTPARAALLAVVIVLVIFAWTGFLLATGQ